MTLITGFRSPGAITLLALTGVLALTTASVARAWRRPAGQIFVIWLIVPVALAAILSLITPIFLPRGFIAGAYTLPIVWVAYIGDRPRARLALIAAVAMLAGWYVIPANNQRADLRSISDTLDIPTDAIVYHEDIESYLLMSYYIPQAAHRLRPYPASLAHGLSAQTQAAIGVHHASHQAANWYVASGDGPAPEDCQTAYDLGFKWGCVYVR
ncbi:MAG: hypothetical protein BWY85_02403 [Firmicutes bacterium ADurb.Bin506]|nr:MAG: hypothetical protein BWY85_02403 [Firmicutes bacterium ADurb.Bin506]